MTAVTTPSQCHGDALGALPSRAHGIADSLSPALSECWVPVASGARPPVEQPVIVWDDSSGQFRVACLDCAVDCWYSPIDGKTFAEGAVTHWRYCYEPDGVGSEGVAS